MPQGNEPRIDLIKANAFFDAGEYVALMKKVSPESLEINADGNISINIMEGNKIMEATKNKLDLNQTEFMEYLFALEDRVKEILRQ